jgi:hypothetical protein
MSEDEARMTHDRDNCLICWDRRCDRLEKSGLSRRLVAELRACLPGATARTIAVLESATPQQVTSLNKVYADATR